MDHCQYAHIVIPRPFDHGFDYHIPMHMTLSPGDFVRVPFGRTDLIGVVMHLSPSSPVDPKKLKTISELVFPQALSPQGLSFLKWMAQYTVIPIGQVFKMILSVPAAFDPMPVKQGYQVKQGYDHSQLTPKQQQLLATPLDQHRIYTLSDLQSLTGSSTAVIKAACDRGALIKKPLIDSTPQPNPQYSHPLFEPDQHVVVKALHASVGRQVYETILLHGVTGSGKTEVYFEAIAQALNQDQQALVLLPEISLTAQWLERFEKRFGCKPSVWHSQMTPAQRRDTYRSILEGRTHVIVGARSALFLPYKKLGVIIVDEEHEGSYKQEDNGIYHARDMAVAKGYHYGLPVVLVSATPALESIINAKDGKYTLLSLPHRHGGSAMPDIHIIDMRTHEKNPGGAHHFLSESLRQKIAQNFADGEQSLLFLNRRGYAPLTLCRTCGERLECPHCTAWVVLHRLKGHDTLLCHHCGFKAVVPDTCQKCDAQDSFVNCGPGVERIAEEVTHLIPQAKILVMASDAFETTDQMVQAIQRIQAGDVDIIIGTQMMAKGHHFPKLTLVGIVDADLGLTGGDLRACEKTYQLLQQVAGRCGRAEHQGDVYLQTYYPDHPVLQALIAGDDSAYHDQDIAMRKLADMPPFSRLAALIISGQDQGSVEQWIRGFSQQRPHVQGLDILGPAPAPLAKLRRHYRYRFLLKGPKGMPIQSVIKEWIKRCPAPHNIRIAIDIDPINFM